MVSSYLLGVQSVHSTPTVPWIVFSSLVFFNQILTLSNPGRGLNNPNNCNSGKKTIVTSGETSTTGCGVSSTQNPDAWPHVPMVSTLCMSRARSVLLQTAHTKIYNPHDPNRCIHTMHPHEVGPWTPRNSLNSPLCGCLTNQDIREATVTAPISSTNTTLLEST